MSNELIPHRLTEANQSLIHTSMRRDATNKMFSAACWAGNATEATQLREQMHTLLDAELDLIASIMHLTKQGMG